MKNILLFGCLVVLFSLSVNAQQQKGKNDKYRECFGFEFTWRTQVYEWSKGFVPPFKAAEINRLKAEVSNLRQDIQTPPENNHQDREFQQKIRRKDLGEKYAQLALVDAQYLPEAKKRFQDLLGLFNKEIQVCPKVRKFDGLISCQRPYVMAQGRLVNLMQLSYKYPKDTALRELIGSTRKQLITELNLDVRNFTNPEARFLPKNLGTDHDMLGYSHVSDGIRLLLDSAAHIGDEAEVKRWSRVLADAAMAAHFYDGASFGPYYDYAASMYQRAGLQVEAVKAMTAMGDNYLSAYYKGVRTATSVCPRLYELYLVKAKEWYTKAGLSAGVQQSRIEKAKSKAKV